MNILNNLFRQPFIIALIFASALLWPLFVAPIFTHHDDIQAIRLYEMDKCFKDYQLPCRWVPDLGNLYGYPLFNYYAPLSYYFGEIFYQITHSLLWSVKIMFATSFIGSFIFMYLLAKKFWGELGGSISAVFYAYAPYHALDFYVRGAMGEMWGLMFFPAVFWAFLRLKEKSSILNLLLTSVLTAGLLTSHNLSALIISPFLTVWIIILFLQSRLKRFLLFTLFSLVLAVMLSSFYLLPMVFEKNLAHVDTTVMGYFYYTEHFKGLKKLFIERDWGYGASVREVPGGEKDKLSYQVGLVHVIVWLLALASAKVLWKKNRWVSLIIIFSSLSIIFSVFMVHPRSEFIWKLLDPLKYLQFPWRFLLIITFFISFIAGSFVLNNFKRKLLIGGVLMLAVVVLNFSYFKPEKFIQTNEKKLLSGADWDRQIKRSIYDYLPIFAKEPPAELAKERLTILTGDTKVLDYKQGTNWLNFKTETKTHTIIRLSQYYFPDWKIFVDGKEANIEYKNNSLGLMTIILGKGNHEIFAKLYDTPIRSVSNMTTMVSLFIILLLSLTQFKKVRNWINYYRKRLN